MMNCSMRYALASLLCLVCSMTGAQSAEQAVLITNVAVFDGTSEDVAGGLSILVVDNKITRVGADLSTPDGALTIDGGGRFLMPGMIDAHAHLSIIASPKALQDMSWDEIGARMGVRARDTLMRGFTSVRDLGGPVFGLKKAVDSGELVGPRIYPSGAFITQTSGHGDFRRPMDPHPRFTGASTNMERLGYYRIVDGPAEVLAAVRENLRNGASQVKLMGSGGVGSEFDPIDSVQFTPDEIRAAVQALEDWGTYAGSHLHNAPAIQRALENGVRSIDHGSEFTDEIMKLLIEKDAYLNPQYAWNAFVLKVDFLSDAQLAKASVVVANVDKTVELIKRYRPKVTFNIDAFGPTSLWAGLYATEFTARAEHYSKIEILRQATSVTAGLLAMSGKRNPYPGMLGVIEEGAYADLLIVDGNPLEEIAVLGDPDNIRLIMKDGRVYKNTL